MLVSTVFCLISVLMAQRLGSCNNTKVSFSLGPLLSRCSPFSSSLRRFCSAAAAVAACCASSAARSCVPTRLRHSKCLPVAAGSYHLSSMLSASSSCTPLHQALCRSDSEWRRQTNTHHRSSFQSKTANIKKKKKKVQALCNLIKTCIFRGEKKV